MDQIDLDTRHDSFVAQQKPKRRQLRYGIYYQTKNARNNTPSNWQQKGVFGMQMIALCPTLRSLKELQK